MENKLFRNKIGGSVQKEKDFQQKCLGLCIGYVFILCWAFDLRQLTHQVSFGSYCEGETVTQRRAEMVGFSRRAGYHLDRWEWSCLLGWPWTLNPPALASQVLGLKVWPPSILCSLNNLEWLTLRTQSGGLCFRGHGAMLQGRDGNSFVSREWEDLTITESYIEITWCCKNIHIIFKRNCYHFVIFLSWFQVIFKLMLLYVRQSTDWRCYFPMLLRVAFLEIGNAYAVLSNPEKRKQYDLTGSEDQACNHQNNGRFNFHRGCEADITPEDLFNIFFGGGFPSGTLSLFCFLS